MKRNQPKEYSTSPEKIAAALAAPFSPESVHWRIGRVNKDGKSALTFAYLDARDVMDRLDEVVGPHRWQTRHEITGLISLCHMGIEYEPGLIVWKSNGAGQTDIEGEKGGLSDATKRAAVEHGIGRYLYRLGDVYLDVESGGGRSARIANSPSNETRKARALGATTKKSPPSKPAAQPQKPKQNRNLLECEWFLPLIPVLAEIVSAEEPGLVPDSPEFKAKQWELLQNTMVEELKYTNWDQLQEADVSPLITKLQEWKGGVVDNGIEVPF